MTVNKKIKGYIATIVATVLWGASFVWTNQLFLECNFPGVTLILFRLAIAFVLMFSFFSITKKLDKVKKKDWKIFIALAVFQPFLYFIGETYGIKYIGDASFAAVMIALIPISVPLMIALFYKNKVKPLLVIGAVISVIGVVIMSMNISGGNISLKGVLFLVEAIITACMYNVILRKLLSKGYGAITITTYQNMIATILYIPMFFIMEYKDFSSIQWSFTAVFNILALAVLCSSVAYVCYSYGASIISVEKEAVFNNAIPVVTIIFSILIGQEVFSIRKVLGMLVVLIGLMISQSDILLKKNKL
ncbi:MAG: EamA family transporter [Bacteroidales bacterium]|nr:EamA family transporter [Bacteroidales bacterium]